jgi:AraC-like DNA-binding protein
MLIQHLFQPFEIEHVTLDQCPISLHKHTFFELVYIVEGTGIHHVNQQSIEYKAEYLFLILPQDEHFFEVTTTTTFIFIRFNDVFIKGQKANNAYSNLGDWADKFDFIFQHNNSLPGCILHNRSDKPLVKSIAESIIREYENPQQFHQELVQLLINTLLTIVGRNIYNTIPEEIKRGKKEDTALDIINYINENIFTPDKLNLDHIAGNFNISPTYMSEFFKKHTGQGLIQYITTCKIRLVEARLQYSDMRMSEIAHELNFTDDSHLNRVFKKHNGVSPSEYRRINNSRIGLE